MEHLLPFLKVFLLTFIKVFLLTSIKVFLLAFLKVFLLTFQKVLQERLDHHCQLACFPYLHAFSYLPGINFDSVCFSLWSISFPLEYKSHAHGPCDKIEICQFKKKRRKRLIFLLGFTNVRP